MPNRLKKITKEFIESKHTFKNGRIDVGELHKFLDDNYPNILDELSSRDLKAFALAIEHSH